MVHSEVGHEVVRAEAHEAVHAVARAVEHEAVRAVVLGAQVEARLGVVPDADVEDLVERMQDSREELVHQEVPEVVLGEDLRDPAAVLLDLPRIICYQHKLSAFRSF